MTLADEASLDLLPYVIHRISQKVLITTSIWKIQVAQTPLSNLILNISNDGVMIQCNY